jgi:hypothetical protein
MVVVVVCVTAEFDGQKLVLDMELVEERLVSIPSALLVESPEGVDKRTEVLAETLDAVVDPNQLRDDEMDDKDDADDEKVLVMIVLEEVTIGVATQEQALEIWLGSPSHIDTKSGRSAEAVFVVVV